VTTEEVSKVEEGGDTTIHFTVDPNLAACTAATSPIPPGGDMTMRFLVEEEVDDIDVDVDLDEYDASVDEVLGNFNDRFDMGIMAL
jgi:hypothetical protein